MSDKDHKKVKPPKGRGSPPKNTEGPWLRTLTKQELTGQDFNMSFDNIKPGRKGDYSVCIFGAADVSDSEITEIFSKFGCLVRPPNRSKNLVFTSYATKEEAVRCLYEMENHPKLVVKPGRSQNQGTSSTRNNDNRNTKYQHSEEFARRQSFGAASNHERASGNKPSPGLRPLRPVLPEVESIDADLPPTQIVVLSNVHPHISLMQVVELCKQCSTETQEVKPLYIDIKIYNPKGNFKIRCAIVHVATQSEVNCIVTKMNKLTINGYTIGAKPIEQHIEEGKALSKQIEEGKALSKVQHLVTKLNNLQVT